MLEMEILNNHFNSEHVCTLVVTACVHTCIKCGFFVLFLYCLFHSNFDTTKFMYLTKLQ